MLKRQLRRRSRSLVRSLNTNLQTKKFAHCRWSCVVQASVLNQPFLDAIKGSYKHIDFSDEQRLFHAHGHTCQEIYALRFGSFVRVPDVVVYPGCHEDCEKLVRAAIEHNVVLIPFGGGTSVTQAVVCPPSETRMIVSLDMHSMAKIKWIDRKSMMACVEAGIVRGWAKFFVLSHLSWFYN